MMGNRRRDKHPSLIFDARQDAFLARACILARDELADIEKGRRKSVRHTPFQCDAHDVVLVQVMETSGPSNGRHMA